MNLRTTRRMFKLVALVGSSVAAGIALPWVRERVWMYFAFCAAIFGVLIVQVLLLRRGERLIAASHAQQSCELVIPLQRTERATAEDYPSKLSAAALCIVLAVAVAVTVAMSFSGLIGADSSGVVVLLINLLMALAAAEGFGWLRDRHDSKLTARIRAGGNGEWEVWLNGVKLGGLPDTAYATIQRAVFRDGSVATEQICNVGHVVVSLLGKVLVGVPLLTFWLGMGLVVCMPERFTDLVDVLSTTNSTLIREEAKQALQLVLVLAIAPFSVLLGMGTRLGFRNCYSDAVGRGVRQHFNTPAEGEVWINRSFQSDESKPLAKGSA